MQDSGDDEEDDHQAGSGGDRGHVRTLGVAAALPLIFAVIGYAPFPSIEVIAWIPPMITFSLFPGVAQAAYAPLVMADITTVGSVSLFSGGFDRGTPEEANLDDYMRRIEHTPSSGVFKNGHVRHAMFPNLMNIPIPIERAGNVFVLRPVDGRRYDGNIPLWLPLRHFYGRNVGRHRIYNYLVDARHIPGAAHFVPGQPFYIIADDIDGNYWPAGYYLHYTCSVLAMKRFVANTTPVTLKPAAKDIVDLTLSPQRRTPNGTAGDDSEELDISLESLDLDDTYDAGDQAGPSSGIPGGRGKGKGASYLELCKSSPHSSKRGGAKVGPELYTLTITP
jgi:hypothetical protein